jgi:putative SOS response-associated peptidase YedK
MCGRYLVEIDEEEMRGIVAAAEKNARLNSEQFSFVFSGGEIFPGNIAPVITANRVRFMTWGFPSVAGSTPHINARSETAAGSKTFGEAIAARRCIVPASGYFEWKTLDKKHKTKFKIALPDNSLMYMAGLYSIDGRFAVLTRTAAPTILEIHDRMPVIIPKSHIEKWLRESVDVLNEALADLQLVSVPLSDKQPRQMRLF